jgi:hypothetical protein
MRTLSENHYGDQTKAYETKASNWRETDGKISIELLSENSKIYHTGKEKKFMVVYY